MLIEKTQNIWFLEQCVLCNRTITPYSQRKSFTLDEYNEEEKSTFKNNRTYKNKFKLYDEACEIMYPKYQHFFILSFIRCHTKCISHALLIEKTQNIWFLEQCVSCNRAIKPHSQRKSFTLDEYSEEEKSTLKIIEHIKIKSSFMMKPVKKFIL